MALSGGPDSTALLAALQALSRAGLAGPVLACHVDHGLRPGSERDADHCAGLCARLGIPFVRRRVEVARGNVQAQARRARYAALRQAAAAAGAAAIATGHTRSDQAETVILRLLRGSGARGLSGIPARRGALVRPLIDRSRAEVLAYLRGRGLPFLEDPSNAAPRYLRNRVRREVMPVLSALAPSAEEALARAADLLREDERALEADARRLLEGAPAAPRAALAAAPEAVRRRVVRRLWKAANGSRRGLEAGHVEAVLRLLRRPGPGRVALPRGLEALLGPAGLAIGPPAGSPLAAVEVPIPRPGAYPVPGRGLLLRLEAAPAAAREEPVLRQGAVSWPLLLRTRRPGDRFRPAGGRGSKKLKAWLIDRRVPRSARDGLLLLVDAAGRVLWIPELGAAAAGLDAGEGRALALRIGPA
ncbi:MAG TPA: tRNA lysidine(34) synthetase TilS [Anaeromyxobacteraceae bacterium]|nr:tRNA lysidine(34) synthetase TilS [Anaeromyxobacteraceae bacterium]